MCSNECSWRIWDLPNYSFELIIVGKHASHSLSATIAANAKDTFMRPHMNTPTFTWYVVSFPGHHALIPLNFVCVVLRFLTVPSTSSSKNRNLGIEFGPIQMKWIVFGISVCSMYCVWSALISHRMQRRRVAFVLEREGRRSTQVLLLEKSMLLVWMALGELALEWLKPICRRKFFHDRCSTWHLNCWFTPYPYLMNDAGYRFIFGLLCATTFRWVA